MEHTDIPLLSIRDLTVRFGSGPGAARAVNGVSYDVHRGQSVGVVGESGSGKSVTVQAVMRLLASPPARVTSGSIVFDGVGDLLTIPERQMRRIRGSDISLVSQDPMASLNPVLSVGWQLGEAIRAHHHTSRDAARRRGIELLELVGIPDPEARARQFPHQFSGGMRQRVMIAMAVANRPRLIIADEPTTALDVTIQAQVLQMLRNVKDETGAATILITHDLGVVAQMCDWVVVMYGGRVVESGPTAAIFHAPQHPYTVGLLGSLPRIDAETHRLHAIEGSPPSPRALPEGCAFHPRCELASSLCATTIPALEKSESPAHRSACHFVPTQASAGARAAGILDEAGWRARA